ncbi:MAG: M23 family metallopeptidase [bacterium]|nr:M23 family metallopeptidase [bacterium]
MSNRMSFWLRKRIEKIPVLRLLGIPLAGATLLAAIVFPGASDITAFWSLQQTARYTVVDVVPTQSTLTWPLVRFGITQYYSARHPGLDLIAPRGTSVFSMAQGTVLAVQSLPWGYGTHVLVAHEDGLATLYAHLSLAYVKIGDKIRQNTKIGAIGSTGWSTGNHLHIEIYQNGNSTDPLTVLPDLSLPLASKEN